MAWMGNGVSTYIDGVVEPGDATTPERPEKWPKGRTSRAVVRETGCCGACMGRGPSSPPSEPSRRRPGLRPAMIRHGSSASHATRRQLARVGRDPSAARTSNPCHTKCHGVRDPDVGGCAGNSRSMPSDVTMVHSHEV